MTSSLNLSIQKSFYAAEIVVDPLVSWYVQGLADLLALETLTHGTSLPNYLNIRVLGADPNCGGSLKGASQGSESRIDRRRRTEDSRGYFFVAKDSEVDGRGELENSPLSPEKMKLLYQIFNRCFSHRFYCALSSKNLVPEDYCSSALLKKIVMISSVIAVPPVLFYFRPEDLATTFEDDPAGEGIAYRTNKKIGTEHIGLKGVLSQGFDEHRQTRMAAHPYKVAWGAVKLFPFSILILGRTGLHMLYDKVVKPCLCKKHV